MKKIAFNSIACLLLSGCLATTNLIGQDSPLNPQDLIIANQIARMAKSRCVIVQIEKSTGKVINANGRKFHNESQVKRFFKSTSGWFKAEILTDGIWGNIYFYPSSNMMICGDNQWNKHGNSSSIVFDEVGNDKQTSNLPTTTQINETHSKGLSPAIYEFTQKIGKFYPTNENFCAQLTDGYALLAKWAANKSGPYKNNSSSERNAVTGPSVNTDKLELFKFGAMISDLEKDPALSARVHAECKIPNN
jgi:hypothetical protein